MFNLPNYTLTLASILAWTTASPTLESRTTTAGFTLKVAGGSPVDGEFLTVSVAKDAFVTLGAQSAATTFVRDTTTGYLSVKNTDYYVVQEGSTRGTTLFIDEPATITADNYTYLTCTQSAAKTLGCSDLGGAHTKFGEYNGFPVLVATTAGTMYTPITLDVVSS